MPAVACPAATPGDAIRIVPTIFALSPTQEEEYERIHMPKNTPTGIYVSAWALAFGFAMIWYIWWLAAASLVGIVVTCIQHSYNDDVDYYVEVEEIKAIEAARRAQLEKISKPWQAG